jgi:hypothetical protein
MGIGYLLLSDQWKNEIRRTEKKASEYYRAYAYSSASQAGGGQNPPRVEYELTEIGYKLKPIILEFEKWGNEHKEVVNKATKND